MDHNSTFYINSDSDVLSSPPPLPPPPPVSPPRVSTKIKRPPPVTPRSFRRFFTPRSLLRSPNAGSRSRHALMDLASPALNRRGPVFKRVTEDADKGTLTPQETPRTPRKRKLSFSSSVEPDSSPIRRIKFTPKERPARSPSPLERATSPEKAMTEEKPAPKPPVLRAPIRRSVVLKNSGQLLMRAIGTAKTTVMCGMFVLVSDGRAYLTLQTGGTKFKDFTVVWRTILNTIHSLFVQLHATVSSLGESNRQFANG